MCKHIAVFCILLRVTLYYTNNTLLVSVSSVLEFDFELFLQFP
jgi:hypothetical protein